MAVPETKRIPQSSRFLFALKFAVSASLVAYLLADVGVAAALEAAGTLPIPVIAGAASLLATYFAIGAVRWYLVLQAMGERLNVAAALRISLAAQFASQFLPPTVGHDAIRIWGATAYGVPLASSVGSVVVERFGHLTVLAIYSAVVATAWSGGQIPIEILGTIWTVAVACIGTAAVIAALGRRIIGLAPRRVSGYLETLELAASRMARKPVWAWSVVATIAIGQAVLVAVVMVLASGMDASLDVLGAIAVFPMVVLFSSIPLSIGGWGTRELAMVIAMGYVGLDAQFALGISVSIGVLGMVVSIPGGLLWGELRRSTAKSPLVSGPCRRA